MAYTQRELVEIGERLSTQRLVEQIPVSLAAARQHQEALGSMFPAAKVDELESGLTRIRALFETQTDSKYEAATGNVPVGEAMTAVKEEVRDIIAIADNTFEEEPSIRDEFHKGGPLGRTVPKVIRKAETIVELADNNQASMADWGLSPEKLTTAKAAIETLISANTAQEQAARNLPAATRELYIEKAKAYLLLKKLARTGRRRFAGNPTVAAKLSNDILYRTGTGRKRETTAA